MMTLSNGNIFRTTGPLCGEFTGLRWIPRTKASYAEFDAFFDLRPNKGWVNNCEAGDWRRDRAHYDVIVKHSHKTVLCKHSSTTLTPTMVLLNSRLSQSMDKKLNTTVNHGSD